MEYKIHLQKTTGKKIYVEIGCGEGMYLYPGELKKQQWKEGERICQESFEQTRQKYAIPRAKKRALGILVKKDCTEKELRDKLTTSLHDAISVQEAMSFVKSNGYINDEIYAKEYLDVKKKKKSFRQIRMELKQKGISEQILDQVFEENGEQSQEDIRPLLLKYIRKFSVLDASAKQKTCAYFYRKGYSLEPVKQILEELDI